MKTTIHTIAQDSATIDAAPGIASRPGFRVLRRTPDCVRSRGTVRLGGMSPFVSRGQAAAVAVDAAERD